MARHALESSSSTPVGPVGPVGPPPGPAECSAPTEWWEPVGADLADDLDVPRTRRPVRAGLALGALGVALVGTMVPAVHAMSTDAADARPDTGVRVAAFPPAVPVRPGASGSTEAISDIWGRRSGAPPRGI